MSDLILRRILPVLIFVCPAKQCLRRQWHPDRLAMVGAFIAREPSRLLLYGAILITMAAAYILAE